MPADTFDLESLLTALSDDAPCGPELDHDPDYQALERAAAGTPERQYGDKVFPAEPPEWPQVFEGALSLARRTRDLRLAIWLTRSGARLHGMPGAALGLQLVEGLLERHWDWVHPQLDASDNNDPTMRLNALAPLAVLGELPADLRAATVATVRAGLTLRELELGLRKAEAHGDEAVPTESGVLQGLRELVAAHPESADALRTAAQCAAHIIELVDARVGSAAPNLQALTGLLAVGTEALSRLGSDAAEAGANGEADPGEAAASAGNGGGGGGGSLRSRADAVRELERLCQWFEQYEPGHPAPLLMRRAQRLMNMSFIEIIQDLAPNGVEQVQTIAGPQPE